ncbi:MAG: hypothetical protein ACLUOI_35925 [Eisenbergiella sp.]
MTDGMGIGRYYVLRQEKETTLQDLNADSHDRFFTMAKMQYGEGRFSEETEAQIIESTMTRDEKMQELIKKYFTGTDYLPVNNDRQRGHWRQGLRNAVGKKNWWRRSCLHIRVMNLTIPFISDRRFLYVYCGKRCWDGGLRSARRTGI